MEPIKVFSPVNILSDVIFVTTVFCFRADNHTCSMAEPKVTSGGVTLGKATVTKKHVRRGQDTEKKSRVQTTVTGGDTKDKQV